MSLGIPKGSKITITTHDGCEEIVLPAGRVGPVKYVILAIIVIWLCGWAMGFASAFSQIFSGKGNVFLFFWLGGWSLGGIFAPAFAYRVLRQPVPEKILITRQALRIDTGVPAFKAHFHHASVPEAFKDVFARRRTIEVSSQQVKTLALRETESGNRLTIDDDNHRIELAVSATEIEREWLFQYISSRYS